MSTTGAILLAFLAFLVGYFSRRSVPLNQGRQLDTIKHRLDNMEQVLERVDERTYELTLSPFEQVSYEINAASIQVGHSHLMTLNNGNPIIWWT